MKHSVSIPRIIAGVLSLAGFYWAVRLLALASAAAPLFALPGYLIWAMWIWRAISPQTKPVFQVGWVFSMVWHLPIAVFTIVSEKGPYTGLYAGSAFVLSLVGFLAEAGEPSRAARRPSSPSGKDAAPSA